MLVVVCEELGPLVGNKAIMEINDWTPGKDLSCTEYMEYAKYTICIPCKKYQYIWIHAEYEKNAIKYPDKYVKKVKYATTS